jgi:PTH1 family peptidyl-tRNA hydrolase
MKLVIGLGNPEAKYKNTRHNAGYILIDSIKKEESIKKKFKVSKSDSSMNNSGDFVLKLTRRYSLDPNHLYIAHDDLDLKLGEFKIQFGKGPKDHNGLNDIYNKLGTKDFWHIRIGIDARTSDKESRTRGIDYVLEDFTNEERDILDRTIQEICKKLAE